MSLLPSINNPNSAILPPTSSTDLVNSLAELAVNVSNDAAASAVAIDVWCEKYAKKFEMLLQTALLTSSANQGNPSAQRIRTRAQNELDAAFHAAALAAPGPPAPNRISTALCCHALNKISEHRNLKHFQHINELKKELFRSIYRSTLGVGTVVISPPGSPDSERSPGSPGSPGSRPGSPPLSPPGSPTGNNNIERDQATLNSLPDLLHATPYFEVVRKLKKRVDDLIDERNQFERAQAQAKDRRHMRKKVLMRTSRNWQVMLVNSAFRQWRETAKNTVRQREMLARYFRRIKAITLPDIFRSWKIITVADKLKSTQDNKKKKEQELKKLEAKLRDTKKNEGDLMMDMVRMEKDTTVLRSRLETLHASIAAQRVPETRSVISAVGENLITLGDVGFKNIESILTEAANSPDPNILAGIYYVEDDEAKESKARKEGRYVEPVSYKTKTKGEYRPEYTPDEIEKAMIEIVKLAPDRLLLRWVKFRCRLGYPKGSPGQRKVENFNDDLRDGIIYGNLLNRLSSRRNRARIANEIDPQRRIDIVLTQASRLDPPASGFITTGHVLGCDEALNVAFVGRLFNTHGRLEKTNENPEIKVYMDRVTELRAKWSAQKAFVRQLIDKGKWQMYRAVHDDESLQKSLVELEQVAKEIAALGVEIEPTMSSSLKSTQTGWVLRHTISNAIWSIFTYKVLREENAELPFPIINLRRERMLQQYTKLGSDNELKILIKAGLNKQEKNNDYYSNQFSLEEFRKSIEDVLLKNFEAISKIFQHYAAGDDGDATSMSISEFWEVIRDCDLGKPSHDTSAIKKELFQRIFERADALEEGETVSTSNVSGDAEITPDGFINALIEIGLRKYKKEKKYSRRFELLLTKSILPKACRTNTDSFRKDISQDDVQSVFKKYSLKLRAVFESYAKQKLKRMKKKKKNDDEETNTSTELDMGLPEWIKWCRDFKLITRSGDMKNDFGENVANKVFRNVQAGGDDPGDGDDGGGSVGGGDDSLIYLEFLEALAAVACFKFVNPYIPLATRLEQFLSDQVDEGAKKILKRRRRQ